MSKHKSVSPEKLGSRLRANSRKPIESILIVCEGKETEPNYFEALCRHLGLKPVEVAIVRDGCAPKTIVDIALELRDKRGEEAKNSPTIAAFDEVWCVFDTEDLQDETTYHRAVNKAQDHNLELALCNPCIETWFLLHFGSNQYSFTECKSAKAKMKDFIPGYHESMPGVFEKIRDKTSYAVKNAERRLDKDSGLTDKERQGQLPHNLIKKISSSTTVHLLVKKLISMSPNPL